MDLEPNFKLLYFMLRIQDRRHNRDICLSLSHEGMLYVLIDAILMSTHIIPYQYKKENHQKLFLIQLCLQLWDFLLGTQERVRNSRGKLYIVQ